MSLAAVSRAEKEQRFLKQSAVTLLALGVLFAADVFHQLLPGWKENGWIIGVFVTLTLGTVALLFWNVVASLRYSGQAFFWSGQFSDEWLAHLNLTGYRWCSGVVLSLLFISVYASGMESVNAWLSMQGIAFYGKSLLAIGLICYAVPVLWGLRSNDE